MPVTDPKTCPRCAQAAATLTAIEVDGGRTETVCGVCAAMHVLLTVIDEPGVPKWANARLCRAYGLLTRAASSQNDFFAVMRRDMAARRASGKE